MAYVAALGFYHMEFLRKTWIFHIKHGVLCYDEDLPVTQVDCVNIDF